MKQRSKLALGFTGIVLAGTVALGSVAMAAGNGDGDGTGRHRRHLPQLTDEQKCERSEQIETKVASLQERITERVATLTEQRAEAEAAGDTELVARIDTRLERLAQAQTRIAERLAEFQTWVLEHCDAA